MKRLIPSLALALALLAAGTVRNSDARVTADINLRFGHPAPVVVFDNEPDVILVPGTRVYYVEGQPYDLYRYGSYWYICDDGYWYRARNYRGPFASIDFDFVPTSIIGVPSRFHRFPVRPYGYQRGGGYYGGGVRYRNDSRPYMRGWDGRRDGGDRRTWDRAQPRPYMRGWDGGPRNDGGWSRDGQRGGDRGGWSRDPQRGGWSRGDNGDRDNGDHGNGDHGRGRDHGNDGDHGNNGDHGNRGHGHGDR